MKFILLVVSIFIASAHAENLNLVCDGHEQVSANAKSGKILVSVQGNVVETAPNYYGYEAGYAINIQWQDGAIINAPGVTCGVAIEPAKKCEVERMNPSLKLAPFTLFEKCGVGAFDTRGLPHQSFSTRLTISNGLDHGFFYCAAHDVEPAVANHIELSHCHSL